MKSILILVTQCLAYPSHLPPWGPGPLCQRSYLSATASRAQHYLVSTLFNSTLFFSTLLEFNTSVFNTDCIQHYSYSTSTYSTHLAFNTPRIKKNKKIIASLRRKKCWIQVVLKTRIVENKDCWKQGVLKPKVLKTSGVESMIVEIK